MAQTELKSLLEDWIWNQNNVWIIIVRVIKILGGIYMHGFHKMIGVTYHSTYLVIIQRFESDIKEKRIIDARNKY